MDLEERQLLLESEVKVMRDTIWRLTGRIYALENFIQQKFGKFIFRLLFLLIKLIHIRSQIDTYIKRKCTAAQVSRVILVVFTLATCLCRQQLHATVVVSCYSR